MLRCEDCGRRAADDERGWIAIVLERDPDTGERVVLTYCPDCAEQWEKGKGQSVSPTDS
jgi:hypothetical protein